MAYILYIPNPECGPTAYTQRSFETLKDLARWSMDQALDSAVPAPAATIEATTTAAAPVQHQSTPLEDLTTPVEEHEAPSVQEKKPLSYYINPRCTEYDTHVDTRELDDMIVNENWAAVAEKYSKVMPFCKNIFDSIDQTGSNVLNHNEVLFITKLIYRNAVTVSPKCLWKYDTYKFDPSVESHLLSLMNTSETKSLTCRYPLLKDALRIYRVLVDFSYHSSWYWMEHRSTNLPAFMKSLENMSIDDIVNICLSWIRDEQPSDYIHEIILSLHTLQYYKYNGTTTSGGVGSNKFLTEYLREASVDTCDPDPGRSYLSLPLEFRIWAADGVTHSKCASALEKLGIAKVRRSEGQRYMYISDLSGSLSLSYTEFHSLRYTSWKQKEHNMTLIGETKDTSISPYDDCGSFSSYLHPFNTE